MSIKDRFKLSSATYLIPLRGDEILLSRRFNTGWMDGMYSRLPENLLPHVREALDNYRDKISFSATGW
jgi:hypothetical protein